MLRTLRGWILLCLAFGLLAAVAHHADWRIYAGILALIITTMFVPDGLTDNSAAVLMAIPMFGAFASLIVWAIAFVSNDSHTAIIARAAFVGFGLLLLLAILVLDPHIGIGIRKRRR